MSDAIVLIDVEAGSATKVARQIADLAGVREVYSVAGEVDLVAVVHANQGESIAQIIPDGIAAIPGVLRTQTLIAFKTYSKHQMDAAYDLGLD
ncbi:AsnC family transcriptional regulator [Galliscardovia ingluviei]|uniref:AsnC family transcriptional regulator n=1 Tax=Galliscardovia ingluviei TaxID=1769422 RepID=A0A8J3AIC0_9BIFI|nr:Lrp/AsnC ligand binding domain-containing protein [Galliscardovia ingluviei]GGI14309.1 AsnC family transcriptional regulator [Galliscardovia ingluviei]